METANGTRPRRMRSGATVIALLLIGCGGDDSGPSETAAATEASDDGSGTGVAPTGSADDATGSATDGATGSTAPPPPGETIVDEDFEAADGSPWPSPWVVGSDSVLASEIVDGQGRFSSRTAEVARMLLPGESAVDVEATITVTFDDPGFQGFGLYVRQNGGVLGQTDPPGLGYAAYVEANGGAVIGIWRELDGVEELLLEAPIPAGFIQPDLPHTVRFECVTEGDATRLRAKLWSNGEDEPAGWTVDHLDATPQLQGAAGSFALDLYNYDGTQSVQVDDFVVVAR